MSSSADTKEPHFEHPPVNEVVCGVQFAELEAWKTPHYGLYWSEIRNEYSQIEDRPPLTPITLNQKKSDEVAPMESSSDLPPLRRVFFIKPPGNYLIQVLPYRFICNWRKMKDSDKYPRFGGPYDVFRVEWNRFVRFLGRAGFPEPKPDVFELTYVNHIMAPDTKFPRDVWKYLAYYQKNPLTGTGDEPSRIGMRVFWPLPKDMGRLVLDAKHGQRMTDQKEVLLVELGAQGRAQSMDEWFDVAHQTITTTFEALTTKEAHSLWGRR